MDVNSKEDNKSIKSSKLNVFALVMITVGAVDSIRNLPATALFGSKIIAFYLLAALFFLLPCALVSAELSARYPGEAGVFSWVKKAFGGKLGFLAVWLQWAENVPFFPSILAFIAGTIGYLISPELASNKFYLMSFILIVFWGLTLVNIFGMRASAWFSSFCTVCGLFLPMVLIMVMGIIWFIMGRPLQVSMAPSSLWPHFGNLSVWVTMQGVILSLCGIELATVHARDVKNPQKSFPRALLISVSIILCTLIMGSLSIAFIVPHAQIQQGLVTGIVYAFDLFLTNMHLKWMLPVIAIMLAVGALGGVNSWIIAPARGLFFATKDGHLPEVFAKENKHGAPVIVLLMQAVLVSVLMMVFFLLPSVNGAYWLVSVLAGQIYALMYMLMFAAAIVLALRDRGGASNNINISNNYSESYRITSKLGGMLGVSIFGLIGSSVAFLVCFIPPNQISIGSHVGYEMILLIALISLVCLPLFFGKLFNNKKHLFDM